MKNKPEKLKKLQFFYAFEYKPNNLKFNVCRGDWIRTNDPRNPIAVRYQTAPRPDIIILQQKDTNITIIEKMMLPCKFLQL